MAPPVILSDDEVSIVSRPHQLKTLSSKLADTNNNVTPELSSHHTTATGPKLRPPASTTALKHDAQQAALKSSPESDDEGVTQSMHRKQGNPEVTRMLHQGNDDLVSSTGNLDVAKRLCQGNDHSTSSTGNHNGNLDVAKRLCQNDNSTSSTGNLDVTHRLHRGNDDLRSSIGNRNVTRRLHRTNNDSMSSTGYQNFAKRPHHANDNLSNPDDEGSAAPAPSRMTQVFHFQVVWHQLLKLMTTSMTPQQMVVPAALLNNIVGMPLALLHD
ncbi:hypothetical protein PAXRUDRAFT_17509 [Paxillus rubicundulus Ve08.2h10]|uniref:Uncharacterized protein n=1 Tax=Paxillus rubicundulus Ve08.2h10 TaxID=930991 RepID=A0A0D0DHD3_9AGAM|nr:hypothetical protein PAXRUDRAFT_17509 [Paxillus rubicundulus Ve08.2h10]